MPSTVLIRDDALPVRLMPGDILTGTGRDVVGEAENGRRAVERYHAVRLLETLTRIGGA